jgi:hypothetical protein
LNCIILQSIIGEQVVMAFVLSRNFYAEAQVLQHNLRPSAFPALLEKLDAKAGHQIEL